MATVAVNGAANAALLCIQMLAIEDESLAQALLQRRISDREKVLAKDRAVAEQFNS